MDEDIPQLYLTFCFAIHLAHNTIYQMEFQGDASRVSSVLQVKFGRDVAMSPHLFAHQSRGSPKHTPASREQVLRTTAADP
jgi:hypothetical protein